MIRISNSVRTNIGTELLYIISTRDQYRIIGIQNFEELRKSYSRSYCPHFQILMNIVYNELKKKKLILIMLR